MLEENKENIFEETLENEKKKEREKEGGFLVSAKTVLENILNFFKKTAPEEKEIFEKNFTPEQYKQLYYQGH